VIFPHCAESGKSTQDRVPSVNELKICPSLDGLPNEFSFADTKLST